MASVHLGALCGLGVSPGGVIFANPNMTRPETAPPRPPQRISDLESLFGAFADATRLRILNVLAAGELCVCEIVDLLALPQPTVSRHLTHLRRVALVRARRDGKWIYYRLAAASDSMTRSLTDCVRTPFIEIGILARERAAARRRRAARGTECSPS